MKKLLILLALASLGATACGGDDGGDKPAETKNDAGAKSDAAALPASRGVQVDNLAGACEADTDCKGKGTLSCLNDLGAIGGEIPGGYCTADCAVDDECGTNGACPIASIGRNPTVASFAGLLGNILPSQCFLKCTKGSASACPRADQTCTSIVELMASQPTTGGLGNIGGLIAGFAEAKQTYCFPPVNLPDGGIPVVRGDAGTAVVRGLDGGV